MNREYGKIKNKIKELLPIESTIKQARAIENLQTLIKNKGNKILPNMLDQEAFCGF